MFSSRRIMNVCPDQALVDCLGHYLNFLVFVKLLLEVDYLPRLVDCLLVVDYLLRLVDCLLVVVYLLRLVDFL